MWKWGDTEKEQGPRPGCRGLSPLSSAPAPCTGTPSLCDTQPLVPAPGPTAFKRAQGGVALARVRPVCVGIPAPLQWH